MSICRAVCRREPALSLWDIDDNLPMQRGILRQYSVEGEKKSRPQSYWRRRMSVKRLLLVFGISFAFYASALTGYVSAQEVYPSGQPMAPGTLTCPTPSAAMPGMTNPTIAASPDMTGQCVTPAPSITPAPMESTTPGQCVTPAPSVPSQCVPAPAPSPSVAPAPAPTPSAVQPTTTPTPVVHRTKHVRHHRVVRHRVRCVCHRVKSTTVRHHRAMRGYAVRHHRVHAYRMHRMHRAYTMRHHRVKGDPPRYRCYRTRGWQHRVRCVRVVRRGYYRY